MGRLDERLRATLPFRSVLVVKALSMLVQEITILLAEDFERRRYNKNRNTFRSELDSSF